MKLTDKDIAQLVSVPLKLSDAMAEAGQQVAIPASDGDTDYNMYLDSSKLEELWAAMLGAR